MELEPVDPRELRLEPVAGRHLPGLEALAARPELAGELPPALAHGGGPAWLERVRAAAAAGREHRFAIVGPAGPACVVGLVGLVDVGADEAGLVYAVDPRRWGQGLATAAARLALGFAFRRLGLRRVRARVRPENAASRRVLEKLGFRVAAPPASGARPATPWVRPLKRSSGAWVRPLKRSPVQAGSVDPGPVHYELSASDWAGA